MSYKDLKEFNMFMTLMFSLAACICGMVAIYYQHKEHKEKHNTEKLFRDNETKSVN